MKEYRVLKNQKISLLECPTLVDPYYTSKHDYQEMLEDQIDELSRQQRLLYASDTHALLLIFQGMDCSGKDGAIRHVMSGVNPQGCEVYSFKEPSREELQHDFLWRTNCRLPERGRIGIFNRSYYEEVVVVKVHPELLLAQGLAEAPGIWKGRYRSIVDLENHLYRSGTRVIKFFLHISPEEQKKRLLERIDKPSKNWKISFSDIEERKYWKKYSQAYEEAFKETSTPQAPWYIVPADDKENARLIISWIIVDTLKKLKLEYPKITAKHEKELKQIRKLLV